MPLFRVNREQICGGGQRRKCLMDCFENEQKFCIANSSSSTANIAYLAMFMCS